MRKKQKFEDQTCDNDDSFSSDRILRSKTRGSDRFNEKTIVFKATDVKQCDLDEFTDDCRSVITDALCDSIDDNFSDPDSDSRVSKSDIKRKSVSNIYVRAPDYEHYEALQLPQTASDLLMNLRNVWSAIGIYEVLYQYSSILRLSPFRFENFCAALCVKENTKLLSECHMSLLKCILKEDEQSGAVLTTKECKDSLSISLYCMDDMTWYENVCMYLEGISMRDLASYHNAQHYYCLNIDQKLTLLQTLVDLFFNTNVARDALFQENELIHEEHCRSCHKRGNLLCCESCPAMYHLSCINPPIDSIPTGDWYCIACHKHKVAQVEDAECASMRNQLSLGRREPLGFDRHGRRYWHLVRRVFVEDDNGLISYYSTETQFDELASKFNSDDLEKALMKSIESSRDDIVNDMKLTELLTNTNKDSRKTCLSHDDGQVELRKSTQVNIIYDEHTSPQQNETSIKINVRKTAQNSQASIPWTSEAFFKLGMECSFRKYTNVYSTEVLALSRQQQFEEKEKRRHLSYKFSLTPSSEFNWICGKNIGRAGVNGVHDTILEVLRRTIINIQRCIPRSFMHENWTLHSQRWLEAISKCSTARELSLILMIFEACIRPMVFSNIWHQALGHSSLHRMTSSEIEEGKRREKEVRTALKEESSWVQEKVKYSLGVDHALWKQKGEEYRTSGSNSWYWISPVRTRRTPKRRPPPSSSTQSSTDPDQLINSTDTCDQSTFNVEEWLKAKPPMDEVTNSTKFINGFLRRRLQLNDNVTDLVKNMQEVIGTNRSEDDGDQSTLTSSPDVPCTNLNDHPMGDSIGGPVGEQVEPADHQNGVNSVEDSEQQLSLNAIIEKLECELKSNRQVVNPSVKRDLTNLSSIIYSSKLSVSLSKFFPSRKKNMNGGLPMAHYFEVKKQKSRTSIFILDKFKLQRLARSGGMTEVLGFNYSSSGSFCPLVDRALKGIQPVSSRFIGCPRPNFQTSWRFRTRMAPNLSSLALQLKVLHVCLRWDDMYHPYPSNGILVVDGVEHGTDDVTTYEMLDKRIIASKFDPVMYRVEYLLRKKVVPKDSAQPLPPSNGERSTQRSGLRERRIVEPVISDELVPEDQMELWQIRYFSEVNEGKFDERTPKSLKSSSASSLFRSSSRPQTPTNPVARTTAARSRPQTPTNPLTRTSMASSRPLTPNIPLPITPLREMSSNPCPLQHTPVHETMLDSPGNPATPASRASSANEDSGPTSSVPSPIVSASSKVFVENELKRKRLEMQKKRLGGSSNSPSSISFTQTRELPIKVVRGADTSAKSGLCVNELLKHISVVKSPDGKLEVLGLKEGQEAVHLPGGKIKIILSPTHSTNNVATTTKTPTKSLSPQKTSPPKKLQIKKRTNSNDYNFSNQKSDVDMKETNSVKIECENISMEMIDQKTKVLMGVNVTPRSLSPELELNKDLITSDVKDSLKSVDIILSNKSNGFSTPSKSLGTVIDEVAKAEVASPKIERTKDLESSHKELLKRTPERRKSLQNNTTDQSPQTKQSVITVGQFSPINVIPKRLAVFDSSNVDESTNNDGNENNNSEDVDVKNNKRKRSLSNSDDSHSGSKKIAKYDKTGKEEDVKLHCLCRTTYDNTKFYVGCNNCGGWYHGSCVGLTPKQASLKDKYICELCRHHPTDQLHCICRTPYDETKFYIGCDECFGWFHGECVGIQASEAQNMESFKCPTCKSRLSKSEEPSLKGEHSLKLLQLLNELKDLPVSQAFLDSSVPRNKRGFKFIEEKLLIRNYKNIEEFVGDFEGFFSDLRYYSLKQSTDYKNTNRLQGMFLSKLIKLRKML